MKKLIALLMVCGFAMTFVACGGGQKEAETEEATEAPAAEQPAPEADTTMNQDTTGVQ